MSSKKKKNIFRTVKFKISLWYAALFAIASAIVFIAVYCALYVSIIKKVDHDLLAFAREIEYDALDENEGNENEGINGNIHSLNDEFSGEAYSEGSSRIFFILLSPDAKILASSDLKSWPEIKANAGMFAKFIGSSQYRTLSMPKRDHDRNVRVLSRPLFGKNTLLIGINMVREEQLLKIYSSVFISVFAAMLALGSVAGWFIARRAMSGVKRVSEAAISIEQGDFSRRVPSGKEGEEIEALVVAFNDMIGKIQTLIFELKEVSDNIAHDLRTPLTRIRGLLEVTFESDPSLEDYREMAGETVEECDRLIEMINTMLEITQTDSGVLALSETEVDINELLQKAHNLFLPLAEDKNIDFQLKLPQLPLTVKGDILRLQRVISNLLDNAIKYTPENGKILLAAYASENKIIISVKDTGCGVMESEKEHIFERFYRCDSSRSQPGNGLGLSLARAIVKAHKGSISIESSPGKGSEFKISLPF
jgi:heavy metal sensor kinase